MKVYVVFHEGLNDMSGVDHLDPFTHGKVTYLCLGELVEDSVHNCLEHYHTPGFNRHREQQEAVIASVGNHFRHLRRERVTTGPNRTKIYIYIHVCVSVCVYLLNCT